ncbi:hypothetical protein NHN18_06550 [Riemerella anatipestifer]|uniref:hypothetical protein n=1 Tax=Riemerella anatipestifer TaxID=34085 RepID=UPI0020972721|nr:hypothetical protein [Riemerella anatipestifer]MCO7353141.1 hypothetical protein [Riemerella anatipestifer]MCT6767306.1 hypothetical protein [Riemerella anatipestifer]
MFRTLFLIFIALMLCLVLYDTITKNEVELTKTEIIKGELQSIQRRKLRGKLSVSYDLVIKGDSRILKIIPEYDDCFDYHGFISEVKPNDCVILRINDSRKLFFNNIKCVVSLQYNSKEYMDINCINKRIKNDKYTIPLTLLGGIILVILLIVVQKRFGIKID